MRRRPALLTLPLVLAAAAARADPAVEVVDRGTTRVVLDGVLREWSGSLQAVDTPAQCDRGAPAWTGPDDASFAFAFARDADALYLAAEVRDDRVVRTRQHRPDDDALVVTIAIPNGPAWTVWELALQPGEPGAYAGAVRSRLPRPHALGGAEIVEAPLPSGPGFALEARVPWRSLPGLRETIGAARIRVAYADSDQEAHPSVEAVLSNGGGDARHPQDLPPTASAAASAANVVDLLERFRADRGLGAARPVLDRRADLAGTAAPERVVVFPRHVVGFGPGIAGGANYSFLEFPAGEVTSAEVRDVTGDGKADVAVRLRANAGAFERDVLHVYAVDASGAFQRVFTHDVGRSAGASRLVDRVAFDRGRITVGPAENQGFAAATWPGATEPGVEPPVTPWGPDRVRTYAWSASARSFGLERSEPNPAAVAVATAPVAAPGVAVESAQPTADVEGVLRLFRRREGVSENARPSFRATGDAAEDPTPEQFYVFGHTLVLVGPRYQGGASYSSVTLPAGPGDEVVALRAADLTDDGHVEAIVTVRRTVTTQVMGAQVTSQRDMAFAYSFEPTHRGRVFGAELARRVGDSAIENELLLPRGPRGGEVSIEVRPARGWTRATYPFRDAPPQGYEALLLPWGAAQRATWRWNGAAMARVP